MEASCQRCHEILREGDRYCPICGMPQLVYVASELPLIAIVDGTEAQSGGAQAIVAAGGIAWRPALNAAMTLAVPTGILCFGFLPFGLFWMVVASAWAVGLYARRARPASVTFGMGIRIGIVTGILASWLTVSLYGAGFWFSRFVLHRGAEWDTAYAAQVEQSNQQMLAGMGPASPEAVQMAKSIKLFLLSSEGRAGLGLGMAVFLAMFLVFFAIIGGVLGSRFQMQSRRRSA